MICCKVTMRMTVMLFGLIIISSTSVYATEGGRSIAVSNKVEVTTATATAATATATASTAAGAAVGVEDNGENNHGGDDSEHALVVFDVTKYGTVGGGQDDSDDYGLDSQNSVAFRQAWHAACQSIGGPAKVLVPQGKFMIARTLFAGPCKPPQITFEVQGTLLANPEPSFYVEPEWFIFEGVNAITVTGPGIFDATGARKGGPATCRSDNPTCTPGPTTIKFNNVTNGVIEGVQSVNAMSFHVSVTNSHGVTVRNMKITSPPDVLDSDGVHVERSDVISILDNVIATGEDCVSIGNGSVNVTVSGITCGPGHGISVGNLANYEVKVHNVLVKNCTFKQTEYGARIKHFPENQGSEIVGVTFEDLVMENVKNPIIIDHLPEGNPPPAAQGLHGKISDIHFRNIRGTSVTNQLVNFACSPLMPCDNIEVADISLTFDAHAVPPIDGKIPPLVTGAACLNAKVIFNGKHDGIVC